MSDPQPTPPGLEAPEPSAPSRREQQRLETRARLFDAALAEFERVGFQKASIDRIAQAAGVARGTFYFHFPTKEHVLLEVQRDGEREIVRRVTEAGASGTSLRSFLNEIVDAIAASQAGFERPDLTREILAMYVRNPQPIVLEPMREPFILLFVAAFDEAAERGEIRSDIPVEDLVGIFLNSLFGWVLSSAGSLDERRSEIDRFLEVYLKGIAP